MSLQYQAACLSGCYTCILKVGTKREANIYAVSHQNAFQHEVTVDRLSSRADCSRCEYFGLLCDRHSAVQS